MVRNNYISCTEYIPNLTQPNIHALQCGLAGLTCKSEQTYEHWFFNVSPVVDLLLNILCEHLVFASGNINKKQKNLT